MRLPYPGLRAFTRSEADLFFGRERCVDEMVDCLARSHFLAVLGTSGSGKSSLVRTGLLEALELGLLAKAGSRWLIADMHPGGQPLRNLATSLIKTGSAQSADPDEIEMLRFFLKRGPKSIIEWAQVGNLPKGTNLLILADQFEELFRYGDYSQREEAEAFVALLIESASAAECAIHVVMTMRSEYLGACALIPNLAEQINKSLYLTPRMTRAEVREAIVGPAKTIGFEIEDALVTRLLNDLAEFAPWEAEPSPDQLLRLSRRADQLPLMQHVLNRLWSRAQSRSGSSAGVVLRLAEYEALGGLTGALDAHAREVLNGLSDNERDVEAVFRCLIEGYDIANAVRRPCSFARLLSETGKPAETVKAIVNAFRAPDCNFLMPASDQELNDASIVDISHESLIRQWSLLASWLNNEGRAGANWQRLRLATTLHQEGAGDLLRGLDLANLDAWWLAEQPSPEWAERYGGGFRNVEAFLQKSRDEQAKVLDEQRRRRRRQIQTLAAFTAVSVILAIGATVFAIRAKDQEARARQQELATIEQTKQKYQAAMERAILRFNEGNSASTNKNYQSAFDQYQEAYNDLISFDYQNDDSDKYFSLAQLADITAKMTATIFSLQYENEFLTDAPSKIDKYLSLLDREFNFSSFMFRKTQDLSFALRSITAYDKALLIYLKKSRLTKSIDGNTFTNYLTSVETLCAVSYFSKRMQLSKANIIPIRRGCFYHELRLPYTAKDLSYIEDHETVEKISGSFTTISRTTGLRTNRSGLGRWIPASAGYWPS